MRDIETDRVGKVITQLNGYKAFIPKKLFPGGPKLELGAKCLLLLSEADRALGELNGITDLLPDPELFIAFYVRKEALLSSQIEGTQCSMDEVIQVDETTQTVKPVYEVVNYIAAMKYGLEELENTPMSIRLIHKIHKKLLAGVRGEERTPGEFKRSQNWIGPEGCNLSEAVFVPCPPSDTMKLMGDLESYYHEYENLPLLIKAAIIHSHFETIHPYSDGNGRLGRLLITFMLCEKKVLNKPLLYLSLFFKEHRQKYYGLLMDIRFKGTWEDWIEFFLRGVRNTSQEASKSAREILELQKRDRKIITDNLSQHKFALPCYDLICHEPIINISKVKDQLKTSWPTIKTLIDKFIALGILSPYGIEQRNKRYSYKEYLAILRRGTE